MFDLKMYRNLLLYFRFILDAGYSRRGIITVMMMPKT